ncbi:hypothetical protein DL767_003650 [Monosporascus sp. MG133]|nr:hypothetical protein DL767_003650 [Monosporascus sp. MG133]
MPPPQDHARLLFLIILLFWFASTPDTGPGLIAGPALVKNRLARQRHAHGVLNSTKWGDFSPPPVDNASNSTTGYLNLTGFRKEDGFVWEDLGRFKNRCEEWSRHAVGIPEASQPVWQNATGVVHGLWDRLDTSSPRYHSSYNLSDISPEVTWSGWASQWSRNATGKEGKMLVRVSDDEDAGTEPEVSDPNIFLRTEIRAREVSATVDIEDMEGSGSSWEMRLHGVHWPRQGAMLLTTTSEKFAGIFGLPHLTGRLEFFDSSQVLLNRTLDKVLERKEQHYFVDQSDPWASTLDAPGEIWNPSPHCEYLVYLQVYPPEQDVIKVQPTLTGPENVAKAIEDIERELRFPRGAPHQTTPRLQMSAVIFSPDCAFFLESRGPPAFAPSDGQHLVGVKQETYLYSVSTWLLGLGLIIFGQVQLLKMQMRETSTPSTLGRISFFTASMMLIADGIIFTGSAAWSLSASTTLLPSLVVTCAAFLSTSVGIFFLAEIHKVQEPEWRRQERARERQNAPSVNTPTPSPAPVNTSTPNPVTTPVRRPPSPPIIIPSDQDIDAEIDEVTNNANNTMPAPVTAGNQAATAQNQTTPLSSIFGRFIMIGICTIFLSLAAASWRHSLRSAYFNLLAFIYLSLWTPQIYRNVYRNCRRALSWRFVIGQSVLRLLPIAYFYLLKDNFAFAEPDWAAFAVLAGWVWIQIWVLAAQSVLGPRYGLPRGWMPEAWEYHPVLREDSLEAGGLPIGLVSAPGSPTLERVGTGEEGGGGSRDRKRITNTHVIDCAICREVLEVPVVRAGDDDPTAVGGVAGVFARRMYMVTPCRHIFHSACLEGWMRFRLQCPICREELPPL